MALRPQGFTLSAPVRITGAYPGSGGTLHALAEDFEVEETLPYAASGEGEHLFVHLEKRGLDSLWAARQVAERFGVIEEGARLPREAGIAGLKDRHAVARQWISLPWPTTKPLPDVEGSPWMYDSGTLRLLGTIRHGHKLRKGHVAGNRFRIRIRDVPEGGRARAQAALERLWITGLPNRFGPQRFGLRGDNADQARDILGGRRRRPRDRRVWSLLCSSLQSEVFNRLLDARIEAGLLTTALIGDRMIKHASGGQFEVEDPVAEQPRVDVLEISPTGCLPGKRTPSATGRAAEMEAQALLESDLSPEVVAKLGVGARRPLRIPLDPSARIEPSPESGPEDYIVSVQLPSGTYATMLLDELVKPEGRFERARPASP